MKKHYKHLAVLGTLCCIAALVVLWMAVLTVDWVSIQEPQVDQMELDKLGPYEEPKPHLIRAKFGLFKMCVQQSQSIHTPKMMSQSGGNSGGGTNSNAGHVNYYQNAGFNSGSSNSGNGGGPMECHDLDWYNFGLINFDSTKKPPPMPTELIANCVEKLRFTLPFIGLSVVFTSASFLCLTFGHFCQKNKKIIEASMLILGGLCQATALLTFVSQIGSEFEANLPYSHHQKRLTTFYRYKYGYSFYLFLLSFSLSELAALFDMAAYFRKYPPNHYVITFHRQEPSPFMAPSNTSNINSHHNTNSLSHSNNYHNHQHHLDQQQQQQQQQHSHPHHGQHSQYNTLTMTKQHPDICKDFSSENIDYINSTRLVGDDMPLPPQSYMNPEVTITTIERGGGYGTLRNTKIPTTATMESFGTLRKENNI